MCASELSLNEARWSLALSYLFEADRSTDNSHATCFSQGNFNTCVWVTLLFNQSQARASGGDGQS